MNASIKTTFAAAALFFTGVAAAQTTSVFPALEQMKGAAQTESLNSGMMRAPLNPERPLGVKIFGATRWDYNIARHYVTFFSNRPSQLNKLNTVLWQGTNDENVPHIHQLGSGCWGGDGYYGFKMALYDTGAVRLDSWVKVDPETGDATKLVDHSITDYTRTWEYAYDIAWNPVTDKMYGISLVPRYKETDPVVSRLGLIDKATGKWLKDVASFDDYYFCLAFDYDGNMYAIRWIGNAKGEIVGCNLDVFDEDFDRKRTTPLTVDGAPWIIYFQNGLDFDYTTGDLYWGAVDYDEHGKLIRIDPATAATENLGTTGYNEFVTALYVPYRTADARTAPAMVKNLAFAIDENGANNVTINWTNPSTTWARKNLADMTEVQIWRDNFDGEPVAKLDAAGKVGADMTWTDSNVTPGVHTYYVVPFAKAGEKGIMDKIDAFVGRDQAGPVLNLVASTSDGKTIDLSWSAPVTGDSNGWFDASSLKYKVKRLPDGKEFADELTATSFSDTDIPEAQAYSYVITPVTADGEGTPVESNAVIAGRSILAPFDADFNDKLQADRFTILDGNFDGAKFEWSPSNNKPGTKVYRLICNPDNDDYIVSPPLSVTKGKTYRVRFICSHGAYGHTSDVRDHHVKYVGGTEPTLDALKDLHADIEFQTVGLYPEYIIDDYFTAPVDGDYHIALEVVTGKTEGIAADHWMYVEGFELSEAPDNDMQAVELSTHRTISRFQDNAFDVKVYNNGKNRQTDYKVKVAYEDYKGDIIDFATITDVPALDAHEYATVHVVGKADVIGDFNLFGRVELAGDGNAANDNTPAVPCSVDEGDVFTHTANSGLYNYQSAQVPMSFLDAASATQTIYTPSMLGLPANLDQEVEIYRIAWEYEGGDKFDSTEIELYVAETSAKQFNFIDGGRTPFASQIGDLVYEGQVFTEKGKNYCVVDFDEPFQFDPHNSLMFTTLKYNSERTGDSLMPFYNFDDKWEDYGVFHSLRAKGSDKLTKQSMASMSAYFDASAPILHLATNVNRPIGSVDNIFDDFSVLGDGLTWSNGQLRSAKEMKSVNVYSLTGALVYSPKVAGKTASLSVAPGIYAIAVELADGTRTAAKLVVK